MRISTQIVKAVNQNVQKTRTAIWLNAITLIQDLVTGEKESMYKTRTKTVATKDRQEYIQTVTKPVLSPNKVKDNVASPDYIK